MKNREAERRIESMKKEGYRNVSLCMDRPGKKYASHSHLSGNKIVVLVGSMRVSKDGISRTYGPGEAVVIPRKVVHSAVVGRYGCYYVFGEMLLPSSS